MELAHRHDAHDDGHDDGHDHAHRHGHAHAHGPTRYGWAFAVGVTLNLTFVVTEVVFGVVGHSLALLADAGHNFSDVLSLLLAWGALLLSQRAPSARRTYGLRRSSILAALANAALLLIAVGAIAWEAIRRLGEPGPVSGATVIWVAAVGVVINTVTALLFLSGRKGDLNIRAAFAHLAADAALSLGVVVTGILILITGWWLLDPLVSLGIALAIVVGTWGLLRESINLALDGVPEGIDVAQVTSYLRSLPGVEAVHDLHIWAMSTTETALTAHLALADIQTPGVTRLADEAGILSRCPNELAERFGIQHATLQVEISGDPCACALTSDLASDHVHKLS